MPFSRNAAEPISNSDIEFAFWPIFMDRRHSVTAQCDSELNRLRIRQSGLIWEMAEEPKHENTLIKVIVFSTAASFGALGAIIASMSGFFHGEVSFHFSIGSIVGFILGFLVGWAFWKVVFWKEKKGDQAPGA